MPWKPATTATFLSAIAARTRSPFTSRIFAFVCTVSVMMPTCEPVKLTASTPTSCSAMHKSAMLMRSPVVSSMSISRLGGFADTWCASCKRLSVALPIAETTITRSCPAARVAAIWRATLRIRSGSATDVPPYFCTMSDMRAITLSVRRLARPTLRCVLGSLAYSWEQKNANDRSATAMLSVTQQPNVHR